MAIVNAGQITIYEQIPNDLKMQLRMYYLINLIWLQITFLNIKEILGNVEKKGCNEWRKEA